MGATALVAIITTIAVIANTIMTVTIATVTITALILITATKKSYNRLSRYTAAILH